MEIGKGYIINLILTFYLKNTIVHALCNLQYEYLCIYIVTYLKNYTIVYIDIIHGKWENTYCTLYSVHLNIKRGFSIFHILFVCVYSQGKLVFPCLQTRCI